MLILGAAMFCFHLSNAYMLPLLSQRAHTLGIDSSGAYAAATILIAQSTMIIISLMCMKILTHPHSFVAAPRFSQVYFILMALCFIALIIRGTCKCNDSWKHRRGTKRKFGRIYRAILWLFLCIYRPLLCCPCGIATLGCLF